MLEATTGVGRHKRYSKAKAEVEGKKRSQYKFWIPPSAEDFAGLMYHFMGKGEQGNKHHAWFKENLFDPFSKGIRHLNSVKQAVANDMKSLRRAMPSVRKKLTKTIPPKRGPQPQGLLINYDSVKPVRLEKINGRHRQISSKRRARDKSTIT